MLTPFVSSQDNGGPSPEIRDLVSLALYPLVETRY